jgi:hypothetical protein
MKAAAGGKRVRLDVSAGGPLAPANDLTDQLLQRQQDSKLA